MFERSNLEFMILPILFFGALLLIETYATLRRFTRPRLQRITVNMIFSTLAAAAGTLAVRPAGLETAAWAAKHGYGLLNVINMPAQAKFVAGFLLMVLSFYYWHRTNHEIPIMWRFHNIHHADPDLDVTTSFRFHFVEILYSSLFRFVQVTLLGVSPRLYIVYELFFALETMFHHSNVRLPIGFERVLNKIIVTPRMHGIHHSTYRNEANTNYSDIFSWWDRLHRSLKLNVVQSDVQIGVPAYRDVSDNTLGSLIAIPFRAQRKYWQSGGESYLAREIPKTGKHATFLAE
jgi:sterol desaturase/sphingolipid hydroxylase (fatty acid hydroxylase superfamily)